jgi:hypothetical protein
MMTQTDDVIADVLRRTRRIAVVGLSANEERPSHGVTRFLVRQGYDVVGVNPRLGGQVVAGVPVFATLAEIPHDVDMVDVFRIPAQVPPVLDEALARFPNLPTLWLQLGITHPEAEAKAAAQGVTVISNRCPAIEAPRLRGMGLDVAPVG